MRQRISTIILTIGCFLFLTYPLYAATGSGHSTTGGHASNPSPTQPESSSHSGSSAGMMSSSLMQLDIQVQMQPEHPTINEPLTLSITVKNIGTGQPVNDAKVSLDMILEENSMPGMSMPSLRLQGEAKADMEPGMYMLSINPTKQGNWTQIIHVSSPTLGEQTLNIPIKVEKTGVNRVLIGSVGGAVFLAGIIANKIKRRNALTVLKEV